MKKITTAVLLALSMAPVAVLAQWGPPPPPPPHDPGPHGPGLFIQIAPPRPPHERPGPPPGPDFVWVAGYQRWDGGGYVWVPGHYEHAPHPRAMWVPHHYEHRHGGWIMIEGHWR